MEWYEYLIISVVIFLVFITLFTGFKIAQSIFHPTRHSLLETRLTEMEKTPDLLRLYDQWEKIEYQIETRHGYPLKAYYLPIDHHPNSSVDRFVVIAHGYTYTHHGGIKYAWIMKQLGFNVILYDERFHGESGGKNCSLGFYEQKDLEDVITDTFMRFGPDLFMGTYGESMGAATVILEQANDDRIKFAIADCSFSDLETLVTYLVKRKIGFPKWPFVNLANFFFKLATKVDFKQISPKEAVKKSKIPILFLHGTADEFIPSSHSQVLFDACNEPKKLFLSPNPAKHAESFKMNRETYTEIVLNFVESILKSYY